MVVALEGRRAAGGDAEVAQLDVSGALGGADQRVALGARLVLASGDPVLCPVARAAPHQAHATHVTGRGSGVVGALPGAGHALPGAGPRPATWWA